MFYVYVFGTGTDEVDLGRVHTQTCEVCRRDRPFRLKLVYRYEHLFWVFGNARARSYLLVCEACGTAWRIAPADARKLGRLRSDPIPFMRRYGCLIVFLVVFGLGLAGWLIDMVSGRKG
jgi:hypothetical protein